MGYVYVHVHKYIHIYVLGERKAGKINLKLISN